MKKIKIFLSFLFNEDKLNGLYATSKSNNMAHSERPQYRVIRFSLSSSQIRC